MANLPLMPRATAVWLVENTTLSFEQIATFCGMHPLEVQGIADGDVAGGVIGADPVAKGLLDAELLKEAETRLMHFKRSDLIDAANTESINIELELLGLKEAA